MSNRSFILGAALGLVLFSCAPEAEYAPVYELGSPQAAGLVTVPATAGTFACQVYANGAYEITLEDAWIGFEGENASVRSKTLSGDGAFVLSFAENPDLTRYGTVKMERGNRKVSIQIRQRGAQSSDAGIVASLVSSTPSSLTVTWSRDVDGEINPDPDYTFPYRFSLYRDSAASDLLVSYQTEASASCWSKRQPVFAFGGLSEGSKYYFLCEQLEKEEDGSYKVSQTSDLIELTTPEFTPVTVPASASAGQVILAEDWSLCPWYPDLVSQSAGFLPEDRSALTSPSGVNPAGTFCSGTTSSDIFTADYAPLLAESRLGGWGKRYDHAEIDGKSTINMEAGFLKIGGSSYTAQMVSPQLSCIPEGHEASLEVTVRLARYDFSSATDSDLAFLGTAAGASGHHDKYGNWFTVSRWDSPGASFLIQKGWRYYTYTLNHVRSDSHLLLGPDFEGAGTGGGRSQHRIMIGDLTVKLVSLVQVLDVSVSDVKYSEARASWNLLDDATVTGYEIWLDGAKVADVAATESGYGLTGLSSGAEHSVQVKAIRSGGEPSESDPVAFTTKYFRCYKAFSERICMEWEDLVPESAYVSSSLARAYELEVYEDQALTKPVMSAYSYNGSGKHEGAFAGKPSSAIWGKTANAAKAAFTRASAGPLKAGTTYWFRVRSVNGVTTVNYLSNASVTLTNVAGTSEWSEAVAVSTLPAHTPSAKEIIFQGFDHFAVGPDWNCYAAGVGPKLQTTTDFGTWEMDSYTGAWAMYGLACYNTMKITSWGLASPCTGDGNAYPDAATLSIPGSSTTWNRTNCLGTDGWRYDSNVGVLKGHLHLCDMASASNSAGCYVGTPPLDSDKLSETATPCVVSFGAFAAAVSYGIGAKDIYVRVWHADTGVIDDGVKLTIPERYIPATGATSKDYSYDTSFYPLRAEVSLKKGDAVLLVNQASGVRIMLDDILIELK